MENNDRQIELKFQRFFTVNFPKVLSATQFFLVDVVNKLMMPFGIITFAAGMFMFLFEALVACLQAYIFAILTTAYINMSYPEID